MKFTECLLKHNFRKKDYLRYIFINGANRHAQTHTIAGLSLLTCNEQEDEEWLKSVVTSDKTWVHYFIEETKQALMQASCQNQTP